MTDKALTIRAAVASDAAAIASVHVSSIRELCGLVYEASQIETWISGKHPDGYLHPIAANRCFVATLDGEIVGFSELDLEKAEVRAVYVRPDCVRRGVGRKLLEAVEAVARERSLSRLHLHSTLNAVSFYQAHGYELAGTASVALRGGVGILCGKMHKDLYGS